jgi:GT2 family glycosyltransferase
MGFPYACNQGIDISSTDNDIFLLNNDAYLFHNSLFWLKMGLYSASNIGAVGPVTNCAVNNQMVLPITSSFDFCYEYALKCNIPHLHPYEDKIFLVGFALLIKRKALNEIGLLDTFFSPGQFEDDDYGIRLKSAGYRVILCHNSFVYHIGNGGNPEGRWNDASFLNRQKFKSKWGFDLLYYNYSRYEVIKKISDTADKSIKVLEVGYALGATLQRIQYLWPNSEIFGIEYNDKIVKIANNILTT